MRLFHFLVSNIIFLTSGVWTTEKGRTYIKGPGLAPQNFRLPCQYFYIYEAPTNDKISVSIAGANKGQSFPLHFRLLRSTKDSYIVTYKPPPIIESLKIRVLSNTTGKDVFGSPVFIEDPLISSNCHCPESNFDTWFQKACGNQIDPQISKDFDFFPEEMPWNISAFIGVLNQRFSNPRSQSYCHYAIKNNEIYRQCFGEHVDFNMFVDGILHYFTRIVVIPDVEFIINLGDWPLWKKAETRFIPIISWCKSDKFSDILLPTYDLTQASLECMGRQEVHVFSARDKSRGTPWANKINKGFWRGRDSNEDRLKLVQISQKSPNALDAGITRYFFFPEKEKELGIHDQISFFDFFQYKYLITVDGTVASYRLPYLLSGNSVVFKQSSEYYEHFYNKLVPYVHYIPIEEDLSSLIDRIEWARNNDEKVRDISNKARLFVDNHLLPDQVFCYHAQVLTEWRKRLMSDIKLSSTMSHVPQPDHFYRMHCSCKPGSSKDEL